MNLNQCMSKKFTFKGKLGNGEWIFVDKAGGIFIEKDHQYLVCATPVEEIEARLIINEPVDSRMESQSELSLNVVNGIANKKVMS